MRHLFAVLSLVLVMACSPGGTEPLIIGHRGAMGYETENTLASIKKAMELGVDMIEIDVFRISSGEIVAFHDRRVDRLTNGAGLIEEYNLYDMNKLILDGGHTIPLLQEVLRTVDAKTPLNIELKGAGTADRVNFITDYYIEKQGWQPGQFLISSFNWDELAAFRALDAESRIAVLTDGDPLEAISVARELKAEAINPSAASVTAENVAAIHEAGFKVYVWTVNQTAEFEALREMGVDGVFSDYPDRMR